MSKLSDLTDYNGYYLVIIIIILTYYYAKRATGYFSRRGLKNIPYSIPYIGNMSKAVMKQEHLRDIVYRNYNVFPDQKYIGHMQLNTPFIVIRDLEILKQLTVKDFGHFVNHFGGIDENIDSLFGNNLFALKGDKWRDMRATLSPAFTSSKIKYMFNLVEDIGKQMTEYYLEKMNEPENIERGLVEIEMRDTFTRCTNDIIATSAFGIKINSLTDSENEFYKHGKIITNFSGKVMFKLLFFSLFPGLSKAMGMTLFEKNTSDYFRSLVLNTMKYREANNILRHDMIQLLMEAQKGSLKDEINKNEQFEVNFAAYSDSHITKEVVKRKWSDDDIVAQALAFFTAGFETSATVLSFMAHELALNEDIQKKLQEEIDDILNDENVVLDHNILNKMKYLDMVIMETMRKWPPVLATDRQCTKPYSLPPVTDFSQQKFQLNVGDNISIPIYGFHHDPKYFPNPEKFDPERFSEENKNNINPLAFIPFGVGPRSCIGSRFALMEVKAVMFNLLAKFDFVPTAKTQNPIKLSLNTIHIQPENGFWMGLKPRDVFHKSK